MTEGMLVIISVLFIAAILTGILTKKNTKKIIPTMVFLLAVKKISP